MTTQETSAPVGMLRSEFAIVGVSIVGTPQRSRLRIEDLRTGQVVELDALELETLAWLTHEDLAPMLDPSKTRWVDRPPPPLPAGSDPADSLDDTIRPIDEKE